MCTKHYQRMKNTGTTEAREPAPADCTIPGCDRPNRARGLCTKHYSRWETHGDPSIAGRRGHARTEEAEAERRRKIAETSRGRTYGPRSEETRRKLSEAMTGRTLPREQVEKARASMLARRDTTAATSLAQWEKWRAENGKALGYYGAHRRVRTARGPAKFQTCVGCGEGARHWAHIHDTDPADPQNYRPMCPPCHFEYDQVAAKALVTKGPEGRRAIALKAWETKRRKRVHGDVAPDPALAGTHDGQPEYPGDAAEL
jgi:hypothetical protein